MLLRGQFCKPEIWGKGFVFILSETVLWTYLDPRCCSLQWNLKFEGEGHRRGKRLCFLLSGVFDRESKKMRQIFGIEGMLGSSDLQRSKSCPLTFLL